MARQRISEWLGSPQRADTESKAYRGRGGDFAGLLGALRSGAPGQWSQNLHELARHFTSAVYLAVNTLATQGSGGEFWVFERTDDPSIANGQIRLPYFDPLHELWESPNPEDSFDDLLYQTIMQQSLTGVSLLWTVPNERGDEPAELYNIPSSTAWPMPPGPGYPRGAYRVLPYPYGLTGAPVGQIAAGAVIPAEQIVKVKNHHPFLRYDGYAPLTALSLQVDTMEGVDKARFAIQQNGVHQGLTLTLEGDLEDLDDEQIRRLRAQLRALYAGPMNAGSLFVTPKGAKIENNATSPSEMGWTEGWVQMLDFVLAGYGVPQAVAGLQQNLSYATLYASLRSFQMLTLNPILRRIAGTWTKKLIWPTWGRAYGLSITGPEFKDEQLTENQLRNDLTCGARKIKEIRELRGLNAIHEPWTEDRAWAQGQPTNAGGGGVSGDNGGGRQNEPESSGDREEDPNVNNARPNNRAASAGARPTNGHTKPRDVLLAAMERAKTNGRAMAIKE